jgi:hypothetical protein
MGKINLRFDKQGYSLYNYTNNIVTLKVKVDNENHSYRIIDVKTGFQYILKHCVSRFQMLRLLKLDIQAIFDIYPNQNEYDNGISSQRITTPKKRRQM